MLKKISWIALLSASVFSWVGSAEYSLEANSKNIISVSSFIQSLVPSYQKISSNSSTSVLQSLGKFSP